jgi:hypothetical protein
MSQMTFQADEVLRLLRQLSPRERLRVVARALPELERVMPANPPVESDFWAGIDVAALAEAQQVQPNEDFETLLGGWPEDESVDDFLAALRQSRRENLVGSKSQ